MARLMVPLMSTVTLWFDRHRALAVSLVSSGIGVAPMTVSPFATTLVARHGWRTAELILAIAVVVLLVPAALCVRRPPHLPAAVEAGGMGGPELKRAAWQAMRSRPFVVFAATYFACCATHAGPNFHTISYAIGCGLSAMTAVTIYSVEGFAGLLGRLVFPRLHLDVPGLAGGGPRRGGRRARAAACAHVRAPACRARLSACA